MEKDDEILRGFSLSVFLDKEGGGWNPDTRRGYRSCLRNLLEYSVKHGPPDEQNLECWREQLQQKYSWRSVNRYLAAANNYFRWCGRPDLAQEHCRPQRESAASVPLTRAEYLKLLSTARAQGQQRIYLLVKLFVTTGVPLQCLEQVTAELVQAGAGRISHHGRLEQFRCSEGLRQELLDYMASHGISRGPIFVTRSGHPLDRSNLFRSLQELCRQAGIQDSKGNPRSLRGLYKVTQSDTYTPPGPPAATPSPTPAPTEDPDETAVAVSSATPGGGAATAHIPQTGDNLPLNVLLVVMLAAVAALVVLFVVRKRKNDKR